MITSLTIHLRVAAGKLDPHASQGMSENQAPVKEGSEGELRQGALCRPFKPVDYQYTLGSCSCQLAFCVVGFKQTSSDPLSALVPVVLAGATCVVAKLFHKQHKQHKDLHHKQGNKYTCFQLQPSL